MRDLLFRIAEGPLSEGHSRLAYVGSCEIKSEWRRVAKRAGRLVLAGFPRRRGEHYLPIHDTPLSLPDAGIRKLVLSPVKDPPVSGMRKTWVIEQGDPRAMIVPDLDFTSAASEKGQDR